MDISQEKFTDIINIKDPCAYKKACLSLISYIDDVKEFIDNIKINNIDEYQDADKILSVISYLSCLSFNSDLQYTDQVWNIGSKLRNIMLNYVKKTLLKDYESKLIARYSVLDTYYIRENIDLIFNKLLENDSLRQCNGRLYIVGLHYKVGDNTFKLSPNGKRRIRQYIDTCAMQAIPCHPRFYLYASKNGRVKEIPDLESHYEVFTIGDGKGCIRNISLPKKDRYYIYNNLLY